MKRLKVIIAFAALVLIMNSCVYSLFPIYTEDTLVYLPELVGKWQTDLNDNENYIQFIPMNDTKIEGTPYGEALTTSSIGMVHDSDGDPDTFSYTMQGDGWSIKSDDPITVEVDSMIISDPAEVKAYYDRLFGDMQGEQEEGVSKKIKAIDSLAKGDKDALGEAFMKVGQGLKKLGEGLRDVSAKFKGTYYMSLEESYEMVVMVDGNKFLYQAHVVEIGDDYFLDLYPLKEYVQNTFSINLFPVHTFMKMNFEDGQLKLTQFDLEKLNELFESNLVRLRHEYVDGNVVITAQPEEIQKFLDRYSDDETVFDGEEVYRKAAL